MFKKVLVAIDLSGPSMELLNAVDDLQKLGLEELVIVHVIRREKVGIGINDQRERFLKHRFSRYRKPSCCIKQSLQPTGT